MSKLNIKTNEPLLSAENISVSLSGHAILKQISVNVNRGEIVTIIGPNGSGKTTLINAMLGLVKIDAGTIKRKDKLVIGYMPQKVSIDRNLPMTIYRFLKLQGGLFGLIGSDEIETIAAMLDITSILGYQIQNISVGQMQRVMLARALLRNPDILVLDEPAQGLDIAGQSKFYNIVNKVRKEKQCGILNVSHDLHMVMAATDHVVCINQHICCEGHPEDVSKNPAYLEIFGKDMAKNIAIYSHHHDHVHDANGEVDKKEKNNG